MSGNIVHDRGRRRDRYIRIACDNCRRRKTRCTGGCPCGRCTTLNLTCAYDEGLRRNEFFDRESTRPQSMCDIISSLETQIQSIQKRLDGESSGHLNPIQKDPLFLLSEKAIIRMIDVYHKEICNMYPVIEKEQRVKKGKSLRSPRQHASATSGDIARPPTKNGRDLDSAILYAVLAHALYLDDQQNPVISGILFERAEQTIGEMLSQDEAQLKTILVLIVSCLYYLCRQQDLRAWRMIRFAVEQVLELQLHTQAGLARYDQLSSRSLALRVFWTVYVLDLRCSFGNNLPATLDDADLESSIPELDREYLYLSAMVTYSRIALKIKRWTHKPRFHRGKSLPTENGFLDFQIMTWYSQLPSSIQFKIPIPGSTTETESDSLPLQLRVALHLRRNQMRILLHKPFLQSETAVQENIDQARTAVSVAKDTVETLVYIGESSFTFKAQPAVLSYFLISALAVFFPAAVHAPLDISAPCRSEIVKAMELVRAFPDTYACMDLQRFLQDVRGFVDDSKHRPLAHSPQNGRHPSDAEAETPNENTSNRVASPGSLADELYTLFESAISYGTLQASMGQDLNHPQEESLTPLNISDMVSFEDDLLLGFGDEFMLDYGHDGFPGMFSGME